MTDDVSTHITLPRAAAIKLAERSDRLDQIRALHVQSERKPHFCGECHRKWPCATQRLANVGELPPRGRKIPPGQRSEG